MFFCDPCNKILKWDASNLDRLEEICSICGDPGICNDSNTDMGFTPDEDELISGGKEQIRQFREAEQTRIDAVEAEFRRNNPSKTAWERLNGDTEPFQENEQPTNKKPVDPLCLNHSRASKP